MKTIIDRPIARYVLILATIFFSCSTVNAEGDSKSNCLSPEIGPGANPELANDCAPPADIAKSIKGVTWLVNHIKELETANSALKNDMELQKIEQGLTTISDFHKGLNKWKGTIKLSYGDRSTADKDNNDVSLSTEVDFRKENFPNEVRFNFKFQLNEKGNEINESINSFLINYDHYFTQSWEGFAFAQRFKIDPLGIDQRWETGVGLKWERNFNASRWFKDSPRNAIGALYKRPTKRGTVKSEWPFYDEYWSNHKNRDSITENENVTNYIDSLHKKATKEAEKNGAKVKVSNLTLLEDKYQDSHLKTLCYGVFLTTGKCNWKESVESSLQDSTNILRNKNIRRGLNRETSGFELGMSAAIVREFVDGSVNLIGQNEFAGNTFGFDIPSSRNSVLSLRPSFHYRFSQNVTMDLNYFFKRRLGEQEVNRIDDTDYYSYAVFDLNYKIKNAVTVTLKYERYYENTPYFLDSTTVLTDPAVVEKGIDLGIPPSDSLFQQLQAREKYTNFSINVAIPLDG